MVKKGFLPQNRTPLIRYMLKNKKKTRRKNNE